MTAQTDVLENQLKGWIVSNILLSSGEFPASGTDSLLNTGLIDSLGVMELVMYVRTEFRVEVTPLEVTPENFDSINGLVAYIQRKSESAS
jgi:acyl carrier protein